MEICARLVRNDLYNLKYAQRLERRNRKVYADKGTDSGLCSDKSDPLRVGVFVHNYVRSIPLKSP
jgi:hypothetical protein